MNTVTGGDGARKTGGGQNESNQKSRKRNRSIQFQGPLVFDVVDAYGAELMPKVENDGHDDGDAEADGEENAVGGQQDQKGDDGANGDDKGGTAFHRKSEL